MLRISRIILILVLCIKNTVNSNENKIKMQKIIESNINDVSPIDPNIYEDARLSVPELITKYGYNVEVHYVTTEDNYIVQLHRISGTPKIPPREGKKVVFWMHGLSDSSAGVILAGPNRALGYLLADNEFDVWLGNARGNVYSANHTTLDPFGSTKDRDLFWSFSWHEIGVYDLPASIDYILVRTGEQKIQYIGHSQGGTAFFVMMSERPEYNDKIEMMHGLAPGAFLSHTKSVFIRAIIPFLPVVQRLRELIGFHYVNPSREFRLMAGELLCRDKVQTQIICENILFLDMGFGQLNSTLLPVILGHSPAGAAVKQFLHYGQGVLSGHFRQYDYGPKENLMKYNRSTPPDYNLQNVKVPIAIYHSQNDWLATPRDIHILIDKLPNVVKHYFVPYRTFNHIDFLWGVDAPALLYNEILKTMKMLKRYLLADNDFDVWLGNARGNVYSTNHTTFDPFGSAKDRDLFWSFSWHEIGVYDLPASIDYILAQTRKQKLQYMGHSQGATAFFVMMSERPEYNEKVEMMHGLAPGVFVSHTKNIFIHAITPFLPIVEIVKELIGIHYISLNKDFRLMAGELLCRDNVSTQNICKIFTYWGMGPGSNQLNNSWLPIIIGHTPAGASTNQLIHFGQEVLSGHFRQYDYGPTKNLVKYNRSTPPDYNLRNVKVPVAIYHSLNDWLATPKDVHILIDKLPNVVKHYLVPHKTFNHLDFLGGIDVPALLYNEILKTMRS